MTTAFLSPLTFSRQAIRISPSRGCYVQRRLFGETVWRASGRRRIAVVCATMETRRDGRIDVIKTGKRLTSKQIRDTFLEFYEQKGHSKMKSASLIPDDPTILLTIAGMVPFKQIFMGLRETPNPPRACSAQKCLRTNDIENVGMTKRHHTFFEMLGNFSFGDYFKEQAIQWAWELLTVGYGIPKERLAVSVYEEDDEAWRIWRDVVGVEEHRIQKLGKEDNFWAAGSTGPCGPCSEIYFDFSPEKGGKVDLEDEERYVELYNLVFMEFRRDKDGTLGKLEKKNIDTGMGLERMAMVLQQVENNYETDLIRPIISVVEHVAGVEYEKMSEKEKVSLKVVGDHVRAVAHLIADGVRPSNVGRGYIVRRLIRRVVRHGRLLGIQGPFVAEVLPKVRDLAQEAGLEGVHERFKEIVDAVEREESRFLETLERGEECLESVLEKVRKAGGKVVGGEDMFLLYDTFGFPVELTEEIASEQGFGVDKIGFESCMKEQRERARAARGMEGMGGEESEVLRDVVEKVGETEFNGYADVQLAGVDIAGIVVKGSGEVEVAQFGDKVRVLLDRSPFYAEGGGQVGDVGYLRNGNGVIRVDDTRREAGVYVHVGEVIEGSVSVGEKVNAVVDAVKRRRIMAHHTATHLLQAALKKVVPDGGIAQAGSLVDGEKLRFDFNCPRAVSEKELKEVEGLINKWIEEAYDTQVSLMSLEMAKEKGAVAMFGEKYDANEVRVVDVPGVSMELCGGTHVVNTADIGLFKIVSESGPSSGVRRIEAMCGSAIMPYLSVRDEAVRDLSLALKAKPEEIASRVSSLQEELKVKSKELEAAKAELAVVKAMSLEAEARDIGEFKYLVSSISGGVSSDSLKAATEKLGQKLGKDGVVLLASENNGKVAFVAAVGKAAQKAGLQAGKLVGEVAKVCGGGGGGRPNFAQAGGKDASKLEDALDLARSTITESLS